MKVHRAQAYPIIRGLQCGLLAIPLASLITLTTGLMVLHVRGEKLLSVQTASMVPTFRPGDALIVAPVSAKALHVGEVISYASPLDPRVVISHRLVRIETKPDRLTTAGDSLRVDDPTFSSAALAGKVVAIVPRLGTILNILRRPLVLALAVCIPAGIFLYAEYLRLLHFFMRPMYRIHGYRRPSSDRLKL
jgi:signal peptidase I